MPEYKLILCQVVNGSEVEEGDVNLEPVDRPGQHFCVSEERAPEIQPGDDVRINGEIAGPGLGIPQQRP